MKCGNSNERSQDAKTILIVAMLARQETSLARIVHERPSVGPSRGRLQLEREVVAPTGSRPINALWTGSAFSRAASLQSD